MTGLDRRNFIRTSALAGGAILAPSMLGLISCSDPTSPAGSADLRRAGKGKGGYGGLTPYAKLNGIISLPLGFEATILSTAGDPMVGGTVPNAHDGMAAFRVGRGSRGFSGNDADDAEVEVQVAGRGRSRGRLVRLVRNHEIRDVPSFNPSPFGGNAYDGVGGGGTTTLEVLVARDGRADLVQQFASLTGTYTNCAGGSTPWGSWISSEEAIPGPLDVNGVATGWGKNHGYNFDVASDADAPVDPVPLKEMGRFDHEAVAVDPDTGYVYQTEDRTPSGFYRFRPHVRGQLARGGALEILVVQGRPQYDTKTNQPLLSPMKVEWVTIDEPDSSDPFLASGFVYNQGFAKGAAQFARLEGCWYGDGSVFFNATSGGNAGAGQVWQYHIRRRELQLIFESPSASVLNAPDNICVSPRGGLVLCEDGDPTNFVRGLTTRGEIFDLVANNETGTEWAGACFSPQGRTLFVNQQGETRPLQNPGGIKGRTLAIWGPWEEGAL
ncbi:MAG: PhoX family protein [Gemmatimonadota bacterium]|nr:PhoX family protein [Gemmatimonadota bacterium]